MDGGPHILLVSFVVVHHKGSSTHESNFALGKWVFLKKQKGFVHMNGVS